MHQFNYAGNDARIAALVIIALAVIACIIVEGCWRSARYALRDVGQWFRNLPFMYGWRVQRWFLGRLGLTLCYKCGLWVDPRQHRVRCPGEQQEALREEVAALWRVVHDLSNWRGNTEVWIKDAEQGLTGHRDDINLLVERIEGLASCNDTLLQRTRRDEGIINDLNHRLSKEQSERHHLTGRVDAIGEGVVALDTRLDTLRDSTNREFARIQCELNKWNGPNLRNIGQHLSQLNQDIAPLQEKVKRLEEFAQMDLADIRNLKEKVNHIIPEVLT